MIKMIFTNVHNTWRVVQIGTLKTKVAQSVCISGTIVSKDRAEKVQ